MLLPTTVPLRQPVHCTFCSTCNSTVLLNTTNIAFVNPEFNENFVGQNCLSQIPTFILYFPWIILAIAGVLTLYGQPPYGNRSRRIYDVVVNNLNELTLENYDTMVCRFTFITRRSIFGFVCTTKYVRELTET